MLRATLAVVVALLCGCAESTGVRPENPVALPPASAKGPEAIIEELRDYVLPDCDGGSPCP